MTPVEGSKVSPAGSAPPKLSVGVGIPVAVRVKLPAVPTVNVALFGLVMLGNSPMETAGVAVNVAGLALVIDGAGLVPAFVDTRPGTRTFSAGAALSS